MGESTEPTEGSSPLVFMLGLVVFLASALLFFADLVRGMDVLRGVAVNAVGAALLIGWAAHDTLFDPTSEVATRGGAVGTALLLYGLYLLVAGFAIVLTALWHPRLHLGFWYVGLAIVAIVVGFLVFPTGAVVEDEETRIGSDGRDASRRENEERSEDDDKDASESFHSEP